MGVSFAMGGFVGRGLSVGWQAIKGMGTGLGDAVAEGFAAYADDVARAAAPKTTTISPASALGRTAAIEGTLVSRLESSGFKPTQLASRIDPSKVGFGATWTRRSLMRRVQFYQDTTESLRPCGPKLKFPRAL